MKMNKIIILWFSQVITIILNFSVQVILANYYSIEDTGIYFTIIYMMNLFSTICLFGINNYYIYRKSTIGYLNPSEKVNLLRIYIFLNIIFIFIFNVIGYILYPIYTSFVFSTSILMIITSCVAILTSYYQIKNEINRISILQLLIPTIKVFGLVFGLLFYNKYLVGYSIITIIITLIISVFLMFKYNKLLKKSCMYKIQEDQISLMKLVKKLSPYAFLNIFFILYTQGNTLFLGLISTPENAAIFGIAYLLLNTFFIFPTAIFQKILAHKLIYKMYNDLNTFKFIIINLIELLILVGGVFVTIFLVSSNVLIANLFGDNYHKSALLLEYLIIIIPFRLVTILIGNILNTDDYIFKRIKLELSITIFNVLVNILLINYIGIFGAVISVIITEVILCVYYLKIIVNLFNLKINFYLSISLIPIFIVVIFDLNNLFSIIGEVIIVSLFTKFVIRRVKLLWGILVK